jgi:hypothetical protein
MSYSNLIANNRKSWLDINCDAVDAEGQVQAGSIFTSGTAIIADLDITNFVLGAVESGTWAPVIVPASQAGGCSTLVDGDLVEARWRKINNLIQAYVVYQFSPSAAAAGEFNISNLPVVKTSNWTVGDSIYGNGVTQKVADPTVFLNSCVSVADNGTTQDFTCFCSNFVDTNPHRITFFFHCTTD